MNNSRKFLFVLLTVFLFIYIGTIYHHENKSLPEGVSYESRVHHVPGDSLQFLYDLTYEQNGSVKKEQHIFDHVFAAIEEAEKFIVLDFFLYNDYYDQDLHFPPLSSTLTKKLIEKKGENPNMEIVLITDEINTSYGSHENWQFEELKKNGIKVLMTDVEPLRDSNPLYSAVWRMLFQWFGQEGKGIVPNAMAGQAPSMTVRSYLKLLNVKANHRKTVITDKVGMILSANPHDASANHSNIGLSVKGPIIKDLLLSEQAAANLATGEKLPDYENKAESSGDHKIQLVTEGKVADRTLSSINHTEKDDELWLAMFYLADRHVIHALIDAVERGVKVKMILDPNENAFGSKKAGLPNRPVAQELYEKTNGDINIRWYNTTKEQYHPKLMYIKKKEGIEVIGGSTNFTDRNLNDFNLETNIFIQAPAESDLQIELDEYFFRQWENIDGTFTIGPEKYFDAFTTVQRITYLLQKIFHFTSY